MKLYHINKPTCSPVPVVANIPHCGLYVPDHIAGQWTPEHREALPNTDWYLDRLYDFLPELGITVLAATHSRYIVDVNRSLSNPVPGPFKTSVVPDMNSRNHPIYINPPEEAELQDRIYRYYIPYHQALYELLDATVTTFGKAYLIDLHSFFGPYKGYEVVLGDDNGQICAEAIIAGMAMAFEEQGYKTGRNIHYTGGYISKHYHKMPGVESLQIEIRYHTYLREDQLDQPVPPSAEVTELPAARKKLHAVFESFVQNIF